LSIIGAVVSEFSTAGTASGLGSLIELGFQEVSLPQIYAAIFCLSLLGLAFTLLVALIERKVLSWQPARSGRR
jgi:ABC-type nitrate/sulfonate/bicarbonate transport system permease component